MTSAGVTSGARMMRRLAAIHDVVVVVQEVQATTAATHERGVGIGGAGAEVRRPAVVAADHGPIRASSLADPVVASGRGSATPPALQR